MNPSDQLKNLRGRGMKFGISETRTLLDRLGSPDSSLKIVHIAGTNGKGAVAEFITEILRAAGKRTGTFTSPQVYEYNDMFRVDGQALSDDALCGYLDRALSAAAGLDATSFEVETATAMDAFAREGCEYAVIECGMGGKDDATNAVLRKEVAVITSVSLEHTAFLGNTVSAICEKKAGIVRGCPVVIHPLQSQEGMAYLSHITGAIVAGKPVCGDGCFVYKGKKFEISAPGEEQPSNAACAIEAARLLHIDENAIYSGVKHAVPAGRLQTFRKDGRLYLLDGAHNPAAFLPLQGFLRQVGLPEDRTIVYGCLSDKDVDGCLSALVGLSRKMIAVRPDSPRAMNGEKTVQACRRYFPEVVTAESVSKALEGAKSDLVVVCGSFTLLKEAKQWIERG